MGSSFFFEPNLIYGLLAVVIVSLVSLVGGYVFFLSKEKSAKIIPYLVSLAIGALIGDSLLHLLPEAYADSSSVGLFAISLIAGFGFFYLLENVLHWHHSHDGNEEGHSHGKHVGGMITAADGLHNLIDGMIIALGFLVSVEVGIATTLAVVMHEIPQEISDMGLLMYAGWSRVKALVVNFLTGCTAIIGFLVVFLLDARSYGDMIDSALPYLLAVAGGGFLYIAIIDLIPEVKRGDAVYGGSFLRHVMVMVLGFAIMAALLLLE